MDRFLAGLLTILMVGGVIGWLMVDYEEPQTQNQIDITNVPNEESVRPELRTAVSTIYSKYKNITVGDEFKVKGTLSLSTVTSRDGRILSVCTPENYSDKNVVFLFLTSGNTKVVEATEADHSYIEKGILDDEYEHFHNVCNYNEDAFAFRYKDEVNVILTNSLSSVWTMDPVSNEISIYWEQSYIN